MDTFRAINSKCNLCDHCTFSYPDCEPEDTIEFGDGLGNDNVTGCAVFYVEDEFTEFKTENFTNN